MSKREEFKKKVMGLLEEYDADLDEYDFRYKFNGRWEELRKWNKEAWKRFGWSIPKNFKLWKR